MRGIEKDVTIIKRMKNKILALVSIGILLSVAVFWREIKSFAGNTPATALPSGLSMSQYADMVLKECADRQYHPSCYDEKIPKLMEVISMEDAFTVTHIVQQKDPQYSYCHVLGHNLSAREVAKDPDKWKEIVSRCPSGTCSNGCIHGAFQERFRSESFTDKEIETIKGDLATICEDKPTWHPTGLEQGTCYHALGHLLMYISSAAIAKSTNLCDELGLKPDGKDWRQLCYDGAYMQIFQPLEPEDFALVKGKQPEKDKLYSYCSQFTDKKKASCWTEGWPLFRDEIMKPQGLVAFCNRADPAYVSRCFTGLTYVLTVQFQFDLSRIGPFCAGLPEEWSGRCFASTASRLIETDYSNIARAAHFCESAAVTRARGECFDELVNYSDYNFHAGSKEFYALCSAVPEPWHGRCLARAR